MVFIGFLTRLVCGARNENNQLTYSLVFPLLRDYVVAFGGEILMNAGGGGGGFGGYRLDNKIKNNNVYWFFASVATAI